MREISLSADELVRGLLNLGPEQNVCLLDSCNVSHQKSHLLIAGFNPVEILQITEPDAAKTLQILDEKLSQETLSGIFTISYDFGLKLNNIKPRVKDFSALQEPDIFLALFDVLIIHDYHAKKTLFAGNEERFIEVEKTLLNSAKSARFSTEIISNHTRISSNFTRESYIAAIEKIHERIRRGDTYQTNLTQQIRALLPEDLAPEQIFLNLRKNHPAPFASFIRRKNDCVVSVSPERFLKVENVRRETENEAGISQSRIVRTSPIKGTRPRGKTFKEDFCLREELLSSEKDRAENIMIVDLLRNDIGRICKFGSVKVEGLCKLETHPTLFHLVSTISGEMREEIKFGDIIDAAFPCGSITGAPKIRTMQIIDEIETAPRGLSMGAIGYYVPNSKYQIQSSIFDSSVAIRTMVIKDREAIFNVGGGIVIDSIPELEYEETLIKAKALLDSIGASAEDLKT